MLSMANIIQGDCLDHLPSITDESVDMVVTSPPYDNLRDYNGFACDLPAVGRELFRVLKPGGMAGVVLQDQTKDGAKSMTTFRTALEWVDSIGFRLFETLIYGKNGTPGPWWNKRFRVDHEYILLFLKGSRPAYFNKEPLKVPAIHAGLVHLGGRARQANGEKVPCRGRVKEAATKCRGTIWTCHRDGGSLKHQHPATFPDSLPRSLIECFCPPEGLVLDPFVGSGTTLVAAERLGRQSLGIEISEEYCALARERLVECTTSPRKGLLDRFRRSDFPNNLELCA